MDKVAQVLTRPFGVTFDDLLTKPVENGGLNLGTIGSSMTLTPILIVAIAYSTRGERVAVERAYDPDA